MSSGVTIACQVMNWLSTAFTATKAAVDSVEVCQNPELSSTEKAIQVGANFLNVGGSIAHSTVHQVRGASYTAKVAIAGVKAGTTIIHAASKKMSNLSSFNRYDCINLAIVLISEGASVTGAVGTNPNFSTKKQNNMKIVSHALHTTGTIAGTSASINENKAVIKKTGMAIKKFTLKHIKASLDPSSLAREQQRNAPENRVLDNPIQSRELLENEPEDKLEDEMISRVGANLSQADIDTINQIVTASQAQSVEGFFNEIPQLLLQRSRCLQKRKCALTGLPIRHVLECQGSRPPVYYEKKAWIEHKRQNPTDDSVVVECPEIQSIIDDALMDAVESYVNGAYNYLLPQPSLNRPNEESKR